LPQFVVFSTLARLILMHNNTRSSQRKQASSDLFGLLPSLSATTPRDFPRNTDPGQHVTEAGVPQSLAHDANSVIAPYNWTIYDADFFALPWPNENDQGLQDFLQPGTHSLDGATVADIPLFPIYDQQTMTGRSRHK
jgi:hypothetical protein